jgi:hypothetical protein
MKKVLVGLLIVCFVFTGCKAWSKGYVSAGAISPSVDAIVERDNKYIDADETLAEEKKAILKTENNILKKLVDEAKGGE